MLFRVRSGLLLACFFCPVAVNIYQASDVRVTRTLVSTLKESKRLKMYCKKYNAQLMNNAITAITAITALCSYK